MDKTDREIKTLRKMIYLHCRENHKEIRSSGHCKKEDLCPDCTLLFNYALEQIDRCPLKDTKDFCSNCTIHCYKPEMREQIRVAMRYSGPRMLLHDPVMALRHLYSTRKAMRKAMR